MHEYDTALKDLLKSAGCSILRQLMGVEIVQWLNVELPKVQNLRVDLLGVTADGRLVHIELQSNNDPDMPLRMAEYFIHIYRVYGRAPLQIVLYVGDGPAKMPTVFPAPQFPFSYHLIDIRELEGGPLLASPHIEDNLLAVLTNLQDQAGAIRQILTRIADLEEPERGHALAQILLISGLRKLARTIEDEAHKMPILNDILDHEVLGPVMRKGMQIGKQEGKQEGRLEGALTVVRRLIEKRFGPVPPALETRLNSLTEAELDSLSLRLLDVNSIEELLSV
jgi:predicted transposase YdaD